MRHFVRGERRETCATLACSLPDPRLDSPYLDFRAKLQNCAPHSVLRQWTTLSRTTLILSGCGWRGRSIPPQQPALHSRGVASPDARHHIQVWPSNHWERDSRISGAVGVSSHVARAHSKQRHLQAADSDALSATLFLWSELDHVVDAQYGDGGFGRELDHLDFRERGLNDAFRQVVLNLA